jgi:hypothetical protein
LLFRDSKDWEGAMKTRQETESKLTHQRERLNAAEADIKAASIGSPEYDDARLRSARASAQIEVYEWVLGLAPEN